MDYFELTVNMEPRDPWSDILVAELAELGFESFVETDQGIQAYAPIQIGDVSSILKETCIHNNEEIRVDWKLEEIPHQNWNAVWEESFDPVLVDSRLAIIAPFHDPNDFPNRELIVIQPQMSFGTGHHQTTYLMSQFLLDLHLLPERVLDMGTGTGVLAILAEKKGKYREVLVIGILLFIISYLLMGFSSSSIIFCIGVVLFFIGFNMHEPIMQSLTSKFAKVHQRGSVLGVFNSFGYLGTFVGGVFGGRSEGDFYGKCRRKTSPADFEFPG